MSRPRTHTPTRFRAYLWPAAGQSTHARIVDCRRWRIVRIFAYPILAGLAVVIFTGFINPTFLHSDFTPEGSQVVEVR